MLSPHFAQLHTGECLADRRGFRVLELILFNNNTSPFLAVLMSCKGKVQGTFLCSENAVHRGIKEFGIPYCEILADSSDIAPQNSRPDERVRRVDMAIRQWRLN